MTLQIKLIAMLLTLLLGFLIGYSLRNYTANKEQLQVENAALAEALAQVTDYQEKVRKRDAESQELQTRITVTNQEQVNARNAVLAENTALRRDLAVAERMQLSGTSCPRRPPSIEAPGPSSLDHGTPVELSGTTRLAVFDLRESILSDRAALAGCVSYVRQLGLYP